MGQKWVFSGQSTPLEVKKNFFFGTLRFVLIIYVYIPSFKFFRLMVRQGTKNIQIHTRSAYGPPLADNLLRNQRFLRLLASLALRGKVGRFGASRASVKTEESLVPT